MRRMILLLAISGCGAESGDSAPSGPDGSTSGAADAAPGGGGSDAGTPSMGSATLIAPAAPDGTTVLVSDRDGRTVGQTRTSAGGTATATIPPGGGMVTWVFRDRTEPL